MSELKFIDFRDNKQCNKYVKNLYKRAFPREERAPYWLLKSLARKDNAKFYGIYDEKKFVGLVYNVYYKDIVFIFYLAIEEILRGQGYGTKILDLIKNEYENYRIILNIEEIDEDSNNYKQRIKRKEFYIKNGFYDLNYTIKEVGITYEMLCYSKANKKVTKEEYMQLMNNYFGSILFKYVYKKVSE